MPNFLKSIYYFLFGETVFASEGLEFVSVSQCNGVSWGNLSDGSKVERKVNSITFYENRVIFGGLF